MQRQYVDSLMIFAAVFRSFDRQNGQNTGAMTSGLSTPSLVLITHTPLSSGVAKALLERPAGGRRDRLQATGL
jgi:hypothetical protein